MFALFWISKIYHPVQKSPLLNPILNLTKPADISVTTFFQESSRYHTICYLRNWYYVLYDVILRCVFYYIFFALFRSLTVFFYIFLMFLCSLCN
jgi:hypothetical protein